MLEKPGDIAALLTPLKRGDILFIDEIHRINPGIEEVLYPAMEDFSLDIIIGKGPSARSIRLHMPPFTVVGDGTQTRDFLYATDVAEGFFAAAETPLSGKIWNVGAGRPQSVNRLVELLGGEAVHIPKRPGEPDCTFADISQIEHDLGWSPKVSFEEGVARVLANIDYWREAPLWTADSIADATKSWFDALGRPATSGTHA